MIYVVCVWVSRFGLVHVDYTTQKRTPKKSAQVYKEIIQKFSK